MSATTNFEEQMELLSLSPSGRQTSSSIGELQMTPLFSSSVLDHTIEESIHPASPRSGSDGQVFPQYGLLCGVLTHSRSDGHVNDTETDGAANDTDPRVYLNTNTPWSSFICGSQGSGKSHTLSCMLENCILPSNKLGTLPNPLAGLVFHYDKFGSYNSSQICEAAHLCSAGIPVNVLVSPTNVWAMKEVYEHIPGVPQKHQPTVHRLLLQEKHLSIDKMLRLMAVSESDGPMPLYMEVVRKVLREIATESTGRQGLDYQKFRNKLKDKGFTDKQLEPLSLRLELLESFMLMGAAKPGANHRKHDPWQFKPGSLTIIDLSCPFIDEGMACVLFDICLGLFLEQKGATALVVALDEAHKFMTDTVSAKNFTDSLLSVIRLQRHLGSRVIISTQEPTISPRLLELSSMTFVHRFTSPQWLETLRCHLAGASMEAGEGSVQKRRNVRKIFEEIVTLNVGEALVFSPSAILSCDASNVTKLGMSYLKVRVRKRLTTDGGRSILAN